MWCKAAAVAVHSRRSVHQEVSLMRNFQTPFTREGNRSTSFRIVPKSETLRGCVQIGTLQIELLRSKIGTTKK